MIVVKIHGGLGNQMFQFALGKAFEQRNNVKVNYDLSYFKLTKNDQGISFWPYQLGIFNIELYQSSKIHEYFFRAMNKIGSGKFKVYNDKKSDFIFNDDFLNIRHGYFDGYWQSERYFKDYQDEIRNHFQLEEKLDRHNEMMVDQMTNCESISIHVRRGDYLSSSVNGFLKNVKDYYSKAVGKVNSNVEDPQFFIFSDDHDWVKDNFEINGSFEAVQINGGDVSYKDLILMSKCKHNIIANSTFSWWAAYLNRNHDKIVIAPQNWGLTEFEDRIPSRWITV